MKTENTQTPIPKLRLALGALCLVLSIISPVFIPLVVALHLPVAIETVLSGLLVLGIPESLVFLGVLVAGKAGFELIKHKFIGLFKQLSPEHVSRSRYLVGLVMFLAPMAVTILGLYITPLFEEFARHRMLVNVLCDGTRVIGLFVLGGEFWDKLRSLFYYDARAVFATAAPKPASPQHT